MEYNNPNFDSKENHRERRSFGDDVATVTGFVTLPYSFFAAAGWLFYNFLEVATNTSSQPEFTREDRSLRGRLNYAVKEVGNALTPGFAQVNHGLGDILTQEISFRKIGFNAGLLTPLAVNVASHYGSEGFGSLLNSSEWAMNPAFIASSGVAGLVGYFSGRVADKQFRK